jgi:putative spermidine/putrescine transport system substrate-binding protein
MSSKHLSKRWPFTLILMIVALFLLVACAAPAPATSEPQPEEAEEEAAEEPAAEEPAEEEAAQATELVIADGGGEMRDAMRAAYYDPFEEATGIKVVNVDVDPARVRAMVEADNVEWDIFTSDPSYVMLYSDLDMLEPIDYSQFSQEDLDALIPEAMMEYGVGSYFWAWILAYSTETFTEDNHPTSWADFWDVETFPGPRSLHSGVGGPQAPLEIALLADGVPPDELYPLDVDRAFASLERIKPEIVKWWVLGAEGTQVLADQEAVMGSAYNARITNLMKEGGQVAIEWNQGIMAMDAWLIIKGAPNVDAAQQFVAFASSAERQAEFAKRMPYGPVNTGAADYLSDDVLATLPTAPDNLPNMIFMNTEWWMENYDAVTARFEEFMLED